MLVEGHIEVADKVVALLAGLFGGYALAPLLPCQHGLADMDAAVVYDIGFDHLVAVGLEDLRQRVAEQIVADMAQVKGFVGIGRGIFHHDERSVVAGLADTEVGVGGNAVEHVEPVVGGDAEVQKALDDIKTAHGWHIVDEPLADFGAGSLRALVRGLEVRENHDGQIPLEILARGRRINLGCVGLEAIKVVEGIGHSGRNNFLYCHYLKILIHKTIVSRCKITSFFAVCKKSASGRGRACVI